MESRFRIYRIALSSQIHWILTGNRWAIFTVFLWWSVQDNADTQLQWNADHQLTQATVTRHGCTQSSTYAYDALGRRVCKADAFGVTHYLWDGDLMIHTQRGNRQALFVFEPRSFVPLATVQGAAQERQIYWYQCDQVGVPQELTDAQGRLPK